MFRKLGTTFARPWRVQSSFSSFRSTATSSVAASSPVSASKGEHEDLFRYTSGHWLFDEQTQLAKRYVKFNVEALKQVASQTLDSPCVELKKFPEGLHNKVFLLHMEDGNEIIAKIPTPAAGSPAHVIASEVATLDFLRNVLDVPAPKVLAWSSRKNTLPNKVGAEYMLMERVSGRRLSEIWPSMLEYSRFGLVQSVVHIERKLVISRMSKYGSLYYSDDHPEGLEVGGPGVLTAAEATDTSRFTIGPVTMLSFWKDGRSELAIDRGPWSTAEEYLSAVAKCQIAWIERFGRHELEKTPSPIDPKPIAPELHIKLLNQFLLVLPYLRHRMRDIDMPVLWHQDLHEENIFVDDADPTKISSIIDWQTVWAGPLFLQLRIPAVFDYDGPYPRAFERPKLPENYDWLSETDKKLVMARHLEERLKKFHEVASRNFNPIVFRVISDFWWDEEDPTAAMLQIFDRIWVDGPFALRYLLTEVYQKWDYLTSYKGITIPCPISFTAEEIHKAKEGMEALAPVFLELESLKDQVGLGTNGENGASHEVYDEALARFKANKEAIEANSDKLERIATSFT